MNTQLKSGDTVKILDTSWVHQIGWLQPGEGSGTVIKVQKNGKVTVRVTGVRNKLKIAERAHSTLAQPRVLSFPLSDIVKA